MCYDDYDVPAPKDRCCRALSMLLYGSRPADAYYGGIGNLVLRSSLHRSSLQVVCPSIRCILYSARHVLTFRAYLLPARRLEKTGNHGIHERGQYSRGC